MRLTTLAVLAAIAFAPCGRGQFTNITVPTGLYVAPSQPGASLVDGRGSAWADYDGDGLVDVVVAGGIGQPVRLFTNGGAGAFTPSVIHPAVNLHHGACLAADFDNDGDKDVFIAVGDGQPNLLLVNDGTGTFTEEAAIRGVAASHGRGDSRSASFGDLDRDGWLDLHVGDVKDAAGAPSVNTLFLSDRAGSFVDITAASGATGTGETLATLFHDLDHDGWLDIYNANDRGDMVDPNQLYVNTKYGPYADQSAAFNAAAPMDGMGITVGDIENDGDWDVFVTNRLGPVLLRFDAATGAYLPPVGTDWSAHATAAGLFTLQVGWGCRFLDYDQDGALDLFVAHEDLANRIFRGSGSGSFTDETIAQGIAIQSLPGFSACVVDFDRDGDLDVFLPGGQTHSDLIRNDNPGGNWLVLEPRGTVSNRDAIGLVALVTAAGVQQRRMLTSGEGYLCDSEKILHFGLGTATLVDEVELRWPSGTVNYLTNVAVNQRLTVVEPEIAFSPAPAVGVVSTGMFFVPEDAGLLSIFGFAVNPAGEHVLPDGRAIRIPISDPAFMATSAAGNPWLLGSFAAMKVTGTPIVWPIPAAWVALSGFSVHFLGVTISPVANGFVRTIHGPKTIVIQ